MLDVKIGHVKCIGYISDEEYKTLSNPNTVFNFICQQCCFMDLPFHQLTESLTDDTLNGKNQHFTESSKSTEDYSQFDCFKRKGLHFMHLSVRSLLHKLSEINRFASTCRPAIISIS